jgi:hypothetical protein
MAAGCAPSTTSSVALPSQSSSSSSTIPTPSSTPSDSVKVGFDVLLDSGGFTTGRIVEVHGSAVRSFALPYPAVLPIASPDRRRILFSSPRGLGIMTSDGRVVTILKRTSTCFGGGWVSEQTVVASCSTEPGWPPPGSSWHVIALSTDGRTQHVLSDTDPGDPPTVSPRTHLVTFGLGGSFYAIPATGGGRRLLVRGTESVFWSGDEQHLVYTAPSPQGGKQLVLADGRGAVSATLATLPDWNNDLSASFSPDGKVVLFTGSADTTHDLWEISTSGGQPRQLTTSADFGDPSPV